jgi:hypothetical protein
LILTTLASSLYNERLAVTLQIAPGGFKIGEK